MKLRNTLIFNKARLDSRNTQIKTQDLRGGSVRRTLAVFILFINTTVFHGCSKLDFDGWMFLPVKERNRKILMRVSFVVQSNVQKWKMSKKIKTKIKNKKWCVINKRKKRKKRRTFGWFDLINSWVACSPIRGLYTYREKRLW